MRIVHLSDIHLSKDNYTDFINDYKDALINDLIQYNNSTKIDVILITGDLVDKGGHSLYEIEGFDKHEQYPNPYYIFEEIFINPIIEALNFNKNNFLFIPGNHDIDENSILLREEYQIVKNLNTKNISQHLQENNIDFKHSKRIKNFKEFEEKFHRNNTKYNPTKNQSTYFYDYNNSVRIGFLMVNDSWRCKSIKLKEDKEKMFFGMQQLYDGLQELNREKTIINIALFHHSKENFEEEEEIEGFLTRKEIDLMLYGHYHSTRSEFYLNSFGNCHVFRGKASLLKPGETHKDYLPGYQVMDLDLIVNKITKIHYRVFNDKPISKSFIADNTVAENGIDENNATGKQGYKFNRIKTEKTGYSLLNKEEFKS